MFFEQFNKLCEEIGTTPTKFVTEILCLSSSKVTAWKNGSIPKYEILNDIAKYFKVSIGTLFDGRKEKEPIENTKSPSLTENEDEMIEIFSNFSEREQLKIIGRMSEWLEVKHKREREQIKNTNIQTARFVARSTDNAPPRTVTGDFSDILNAPDATDEY